METAENPKKKFYKRWWFWVGAVFVLFIIIGINGSGNGSSQTAASVPAPNESGSSALAAPTTQAATEKSTAAPTAKSVPAANESQPAPAPAPKPAPTAPQTLLEISGSGSKTTESFTTAGAWNLTYSYDCSSFGDRGNFQVFIYNGDGSMSFSNSGVNQLGASGSDTDYYHTGGTFYLEVNSECSWHIQVKG